MAVRHLRDYAEVAEIRQQVVDHFSQLDDEFDSRLLAKPSDVTQ